MKNHIKSPDLFNFAKDNLHGIHIYYASNEKIDDCYQNYLKERFAKAKTMKFHYFKANDNRLECKLTSFDDNTFMKKIM